MKTPLIILTCCCLFGCKSEVEPISVSNLTGTVVIYNEFGEIIGEDLSGSMIQLSSGSETVTDENGAFEIRDLKYGEHIVNISRTGFIEYTDTITNHNIELDRTYGLLEISTTEISEITVSEKNIDDGNWLSFTINYKINPVDENLYKRNIRIYIGSGGIDYKCDTCWEFSISPTKQVEWNQYEVQLSESNLNSIGIKRGETVSIMIFPYSGILFRNELNESKILEAYGEPSKGVELTY